MIEIDTVSVLAVADAALVAAAALGYFLSSRIRPPSTPDLPSAFLMLEHSIEKYPAGVPTGYTWGEAFAQLKRSGVKADWESVERRLAEYEAFRFGGREAPKEGQKEIVSLAMKLRRSDIG